MKPPRPPGPTGPRAPAPKGPPMPPGGNVPKVEREPTECCKSTFVVLLTMLLAPCIATIYIGLDQWLKATILKESKGTTDSKVYPLLVNSLKVTGMSGVIVGALQLIIILIGCIGKCCKSVPCLQAFWIMVIAIILSELFLCFVAVWALIVVAADIRPSLYADIQKYDGGENFPTYFFDSMQLKHGCCGINSSLDYQFSEWFQNTVPKSVVPMSCCKLNLKPAESEEDMKRYSKLLLDPKELKLDDLNDKNCPLLPNGKANTNTACTNAILTETLDGFVASMSTAVGYVVSAVITGCIAKFCIVRAYI